MQENTDGQYNEPGKQINKQDECFTKDMETLKKNKMKILETKNSKKV